MRALFLTLSLSFACFTAQAAPAPAKSIYDFEVKQINGAMKTAAPKKLAAYKGKVLLIVNVASQCGFTKQYKGLQELYTKYEKQGFEILGFPSNDFGAQEPGSNEEIKNFCERNFKVSFPLFEKAPVNGTPAQPLYVYLKENAPSKGEISWNFEKFLVGKDGKIIGRYKSKVTPESEELNGAIDAALKAKM